MLSYPCPTCKTLKNWQDNPYRPFCSERCRLIDLGQWANESYLLVSESQPFTDELDNPERTNFSS